MQLSWDEALARRRVSGAASKFPTKGDERARRPRFEPRFQFRRADPVFTIGSCFARNIEEKLEGFDLPTMRFSTPKSEWGSRPNGLLNEYNPGTMNQRIRFALSGGEYPEDTIVESGGGVADLALHGGAPVTRERAIERRREIAAVYAELARCTVVIVTLGFVEAWFDTKHGLYINQMPPPEVLKASGDRFVFRRMDVQESFDLLDDALGALVGAGKNVVLSVSPVPISSTFTGFDAVTANEYSKAVLRTCAQRLHEKYERVDYFPSYEIVRLQGEAAYKDDNVHVRNDVVGEITSYMMGRYILDS